MLLVKVLQVDEQLATAVGVGPALCSNSDFDGPMAILKCSMKSRKLIDTVPLLGVASRTLGRKSSIADVLFEFDYTFIHYIEYRF